MDVIGACVARRACACAVVVFALNVIACAPRSATVAEPGAPLAAVLLSGPNRVVVVDLVAGSVVKSYELRSLALDLAIDPDADVVITSQCGGIADEADDVVSLCPLREDGNPTYVRLERPNPGSLAVYRGSAYVTHGWYEDESLYTSVVDVRRRRLVRETTIPDGPGWLASAGDRLWTLATPALPPLVKGSPPPAVEETGARLASVDPDSMSSTKAGWAADGAVGVVSDGDRVYVYGNAAPDADGSRSGYVAEIDTATGECVRSGGTGPLAHIAAEACVVGGRILVVDRADDMDAQRGIIAAVDASSLEPVGRFVKDAPISAIAAFDTSAVVVDAESGVLTIIDAKTGKTRRTIDLGVEGAFAARVAVAE